MLNLKQYVTYINILPISFISNKRITITDIKKEKIFSNSGQYSETYLEPSQTNRMELFAKIVTIFAKGSNLVVLPGSECNPGRKRTGFRDLHTRNFLEPYGLSPFSQKLLTKKLKEIQRFFTLFIYPHCVKGNLFVSCFPVL